MSKPKVQQFVNLTSSPVTLPNENRSMITVACFQRRHLHKDGIFMVEGEHYAQFVHPYGPLRVLPEGENASTFRESHIITQAGYRESVPAETDMDNSTTEKGDTGEGEGEGEENPDDPASEGEGEESTTAKTEEADTQESTESTPVTDEAGESNEVADGNEPSSGETIEDANAEGDSTAKTEEDDGETVKIEEVEVMTKADLVEFAKFNKVNASGNRKTLLARIKRELF